MLQRGAGLTRVRRERHEKYVADGVRIFRKLVKSARSGASGGAVQILKGD
jgi:hypothetical protein